MKKKTHFLKNVFWVAREIFNYDKKYIYILLISVVISGILPPISTLLSQEVVNALQKKMHIKIIFFYVILYISVDLVDTLYKYGLQYYVFAKDELVSDDPQNERFLVHQKFNQTVEEDEEIPMQIADDLNEYVNDHIIYKIVVSHNDTSYLDKVAEVIKKETDADAIRSGKKVLAVKARGVSKAEAIKKLAQKLGILIKDIIAFGDEVNDIEMLTLVGLGIAMENADDVVKEAADQIAGRNDQDGVGKELEKIFGNAGK